jgi:uncharacterized protein
MMQNRLSHEASPYLLQHASNPVEWFPWCDEAFEKAILEDKPIFLSIGYSACHWCHVMAHESFDDEEVADLMNKTFISIKVDREEMPHIDAIYMQACQILIGSGGWPLTIIMTPEKQPFFAATYMPKRSRQGLMGLMELIPVIHRVWLEKKDDIISEASQINRMIRQSTAVKPGEGLDPKLLRDTYSELKDRFDQGHGGFSPAPKFPMPHHIMFLLRYFRRTAEQEALDMAVKTLAAMRSGGIYDHVGFGFHRYSTDDEWLVPHFEKMLYDQALLAYAYTEAHQLTGRTDFRKTAEEILAYVLHELRTPEGLFAGAQDADSEGGEGRYYLWTISEIQAILDKDEYSIAREAFSLSDEGNFPEGREKGLNIIHLKDNKTDLALKLGIDQEKLSWMLDLILEKLHNARRERISPFKDLKALTDWNGLMIASFAKAGAVFSRQEYIDAAKAAADFILKNMLIDGRLKHVFMAGNARIEGGLEDYAFLIWGLIELFEATFEPGYLKAAAELNTALLEHFRDSERFGFYSTADDAEVPLVRMKTGYDNAVPSGNSVAMLNLLRLAGLTGDLLLKDFAAETGKAFSGLASRIPWAYTFMMCALDYMAGPDSEVVIAGNIEEEDTRTMIKAMQSRFLPHAVVWLKPGGIRTELPSFMQNMHPLGNKAAAYVCTDSFCHEPTTDVSKMLEYLSAKG